MIEPDTKQIYKAGDVVYAHTNKDSSFLLETLRKKVTGDTKLKYAAVLVSERPIRIFDHGNDGNGHIYGLIYQEEE